MPIYSDLCLYLFSNCKKQLSVGKNDAMTIPSRYSLQMTGICAMLHFLVDALCLCCLYQIASQMKWSLTEVFITYNVLAFLTQPFTGMISDRVSWKHWVLMAAIILLTGAVLVTSLLLAGGIQSVTGGSIVVAILLGMGNSLFHVWGVRETAVRTGNDIRALGAFVSTGAFGLAVGMICFSWLMIYACLILICLLAGTYLHEEQKTQASCGSSRPSTKGVTLSLTAILLSITILMALVLFRSYVGETFTSGITKSQTAILLIGAISMAGKMLGGWIAKSMGIIRSMIGVLVILLLCMIFREDSEALLYIGLFAVNCTMPVTLYLANVVLEGREGLAFGLLAASLMPGYLLAFI